MPYDTSTPRGLELARASRRRHYRKFREKYIKKSLALRQEKIKYAQRLKSSTPCTDCGIQYPHYVMEFDHCRGEKSGGVTWAVNSWKQFLAEIEKCDIVCANCHCIRTYMRKVAGRETDSKPVLLGS